MNERKEIDTLRLMLALVKKWKIILCAAVLGALVMFLYTEYLVTPLYASTATIYISNRVAYSSSSDSVNVSDVYSSQSLVPIYSSIVYTNAILEDVAESCNLSLTPTQIASMLSISSVENTSVIRLTASSPNGEFSAMIANSVAEAANTGLAQYAPGSASYVIDEAEPASSPYYPSTKKNVAIGFIAGAFIVVAAVAVGELMNKKIRTEDEFAEIIGEPVLGVISNIE